MREFIHKRVFGPNYRWWALSVVVLAVFIATTDLGLLTISLPVITTEFDADITFAGWIVFIYALVTASLYLPSGRLSDLIGRRKTFCAGFLLYGIGSVVAGLSLDPTQLICFRALQAIGSALMMTNTFALTIALFPVHERGKALGLSGGLVSALGFTLGPILGGFITYTLGWRFVFFVTSLLALAGFATARFVLLEESERHPTQRTREPFDFIGAVSFALGLSSLLLAMTAGGGSTTASWMAGALYLVSILLFGFFIWWEARTPYPILDLGLFRIVPFAAGNVARLASFVALSTNEMLMPFFLQFGLRLDPLNAGALMAPTAVALAVAAPLSGWLSDRLGTRVPCSAGATIMAAGFFRLSLLGSDARPVDVVLALALLGIGLGLFQTPNNHALMGAVPSNRLGVASSFISIIRSVGRSVGTALATILVSARLFEVTGQRSDLRVTLNQEGDPLLLLAFMEGYRSAYTMAAVLCMIATVASVLKAPRGREP